MRHASIIKSIFAAVALLSAGCAWAETETVGGYTWTYRINGDTAEIYNNGNCAIAPKPTGVLTIPSTLGGKPVTSIGSSAFSGCSGLASVTIPNSVTSIGERAFHNCSGLTSVTIPDSVTSIGDYAFFWCSGLTSVTIPSSVTSIGERAFYGCSGLTSVTIGNGVTSIGERVFYGCSGLASVTMPDSVTRIGESAFSGCSAALYDTNSIPGVIMVDGWAIGNTGSLSGSLDLTGIRRGIGSYAFRGCSGLTSVTIPDSVTSIGDYAFRGCSGLTSVTIPNSVTSIGERAFYGCSGLTSVTIGNGVTSIGEGVFVYCSRLMSFMVVAGNTSYKSESGLLLTKDGKTLVAGVNGNVTIPNSVTSIGDYAFHYSRGLTSVTIPDSVTSIGDYAFYYCSGLTSVTIPDSVTSIGEGAFYACDGLADAVGLVVVRNVLYCCCTEIGPNVTIPDGVVGIGECAFYGCSGLTGVTIPDSVTNIGVGAFADCGGLTSVTIGNSVTSIGEGAFEGCISLTSITIPDSVTSIGAGVFGGCSGLVSLTIGNGMKNIEDWAFAGLDGLANVTIGNGVTSIGESAFEGCGGLTNITIGNSVTSIGDWAFADCGGLTSVTIPDSVTSIGKRAFYGCSGLTSVTIGNGVTSIGEGAFEGCISLTSITIPDSVTSIGAGVFGDCSGLVSLTIGNGMKSIEDGAFAGLDGLANVTIGNGVKSIGESAFESCSGLTSVTIPDSVTNIGDWAFADCGGLTSVTIGNGVTSIGENAFESCSGLTSVTIPNSVTSIGDLAFADCGGLTNVTIGSGVTNIGESAFEGCEGLSKVVICGDALERIGSCAFKYCIRLGELIIPQSVMEIGDEAFYGIGIDHEGRKDKYPDIWSRSNWRRYFGVVTVPWKFASDGYEYSYSGLNDFCLRVFGCSPENINEYSHWYYITCENEYYCERYIDVGNIEILVDDVVVLPDKNGNGLICKVNDGEANVVNPMTYDTIAMYAIPSSSCGYCIMSIGSRAFAGCDGLTSVTLPDSVTNIGERAFSGCSGLTSMTIPSGVMSIGELAFYGCRGLTSVTISSGVKSIGEYAFDDCRGLTNVTVPASVTNIGEGAFAICSRLKSVVLPTWCKSVKVYYDTDDCKYYVKDKAVNLGNYPWLKPVSLGYYLFVADEDDEGITLNSIKITYKDVVIGLPLSISTEDMYEAGPDGSFSLNIDDCMSEALSPKVTVKGLPSGIKYDSKTMTISGKATKPGIYTVTVSATNATVKKPVTATFELVVPNLASEKLPGLEQETDAYGIVTCGVAFEPGLVDCSPENGWTVKAAGLPTGLKLVQDKKTGAYSITGVPTKAGTFTVTFTASKKGEKNQVATITLVTKALPEWAVGTFSGFVEYSASPGSGSDFGSITMTVSANGKVSGKMALVGTNYTFSAASYAMVDGNNCFMVDAEAKAGKTVRPLRLLVIPCDAPESSPSLINARAVGSLDSPLASEILMCRGMWKDKSTAAAAKTELAKWEGVYTLSMADGGYLSLTVVKDGNVKASGKLADGTSVSATAPLMYDGETGFLTCVYSAPSAYKGGSLAMSIGFNEGEGGIRTLGNSRGIAQWTSLNPQATGEYGAGFNGAVSFVGAYYNKLEKLNAYYELLRVSFDGMPSLGYTFKETAWNESGKKATTSSAATAEAINTLWQDGLTAAVNEKGAFVVEKATKPVQNKETKEWSYKGANDGALTLSFAQATGIFKGSYTLWYDYESAHDYTTGKSTVAHTSKKVSFEGIMVQGSDEMRGFYLWDASSSYMDEKTGNEKAYKYKESFPVRLAR